MNRFNYLSVLISIILALAISQVLSGLSRLVQLRERAVLYWPSILWAGILLLLDVQTWWTLFGMRARREWNFFAFLLVLAQPILLYLLAVLVFPDFERGEELDLRANYLSNVRWFFGLLVALLVASFSKDLVLYGRPPEGLNLAAHITFIVLASAAAFTRRERVHRFLVVPAAAAVIGYIATLFSHLQ